VIKKIKHKGLKRLYEKGQRQGVQPSHVEDLEDILALLDAASGPVQMDLPGMDFHPLKGARNGYYSVHVNGNWAVTFTFDGEDADQVDYEDYH